MKYRLKRELRYYRQGGAERGYAIMPAGLTVEPVPPQQWTKAERACAKREGVPVMFVAFEGVRRMVPYSDTEPTGQTFGVVRRRGRGSNG